MTSEMGQRVARHIQGIRATIAALLPDRRGNVLAMSAAALVPLMAIIGGAIDLSRLYMTQTRLQQACDAGALAARRGMADVNTLSDADKAVAASYFKFNFPDNTYSVGAPTPVYTRGGVGTVVGNVSLAVPMTIMRMFGYNTMTLNVSCQSTLIVPNTDVMFVLDVTGSMGQIPSGDNQSKISGLKQAVKDFFAALGPGTASGPGRVRYGFVPYSSNVNVGKIVYALNPNYIVGGTGSENWTYQSRVPVLTTDYYISSYGPESAQTRGTTTTESAVTWPTTWQNQTSAIGSSQSSYTGLTSTQCGQQAVPATTKANSGSETSSGPSDEAITYPTTTQTRTYTLSQPETTRRYRYLFTDNNNKNKTTCQLQYQDGTLTATTPSTSQRSVTWSQKFKSWAYQRISYDVSGVVQNGIADNPAYFRGFAPDTTPNANTSSTISWNGCIEEASTVNTITAASALTDTAGANDLSIDLIPSSTETRWKPYLPTIEYLRNGNLASSTCPIQASALSQYQSDYVVATKSSATFNAYVDSLAAAGQTYHDIGLIWGARFLSPDGIFSATNSDAVAPGGFQTSRHIVFMTDGQIQTSTTAYEAWGINSLDGRATPTSSTNAQSDAIHKRRTSMICNAMKGKGFTIWVIGFGISTMPQELQDCASDSNHWSVAANSATLRARFQQIAQTIGGLRLSQ